MEPYHHYVSGFFADRAGAEAARAALIERQVPARQLAIFDAESRPATLAPQTTSNQSLTNIVTAGTIGTVVGAGLGGLAEIALVASSVTLFVASPLIAPLVMLGWGASVGAMVGAAAGVAAPPEPKSGFLADLVGDAVSQGQIVLLAETYSAAETEIARGVLERAVGASKDVEAP